MQKGIDYIGVGVGAAIINKEGKIFLAKRGQQARNERGKWEIPGGSVEFGETTKEAAIREIEEEFGFSITIIDMLDLCDHILPEEKQHWVSPTYLCKIKHGEPKILEEHKCDQIGWFTLDEASKLSLTKVTEFNIEDLKRRFPDGLPDFY